MNIRELEIVKYALEEEISRQKEHKDAEHPAFKEWSNEMEKLLVNISTELTQRKAKQKMIKYLKR